MIYELIIILNIYLCLLNELTQISEEGHIQLKREFNNSLKNLIIVAFSKNSSFATVVKFFHMIGLYILRSSKKQENKAKLLSLLNAADVFG